jgi:hypothetical protein
MSENRNSRTSPALRRVRDRLPRYRRAVADTSTVALAGIIATGFVGIAGPIVTTYGQRWARRDERRVVRENEFRGVAEEAAVGLTQALGRLQRTTGCPRDGDEDEQLHKDAQRLLLLEDRLDIRVSPDADESKHYHAAVAAWQRAYSTREPDVRDPTKWQQDIISAHASFKAFKRSVANRVGPDG